MRFLYLIVGALLGVYVGLDFGGAPTYPVQDIVWVAPDNGMKMMDGMVCYYRRPPPLTTDKRT